MHPPDQQHGFILADKQVENDRTPADSNILIQKEFTLDFVLSLRGEPGRGCQAAACKFILEAIFKENPLSPFSSLESAIASITKSACVQYVMKKTFVSRRAGFDGMGHAPENQ